MASRISNKGLLDKCKEVVVADPVTGAMDELIKNAIVTVSRRISNAIDPKPLAWNRTSYDSLFTRSSASITGITKADPGVFTADSLDTDITGHGFTDDDIVFLTGLSDDSMDELNDRFFRLHKIDATTFSLHTLDGSDYIATDTLDAWDSGGYIYHAGVLLPKTSIEPQTGNSWEKWLIEDVYSVTFDSLPCWPISEEEVLSDPEWMRPGGQPKRWRYVRNNYQGFDPSDTEHFLFFNPPTAQQYNIRAFIKKGYPDIFEWTESAYPPHPPDVHDCIWHMALALLVANTEKQRRASTDGRSLMGSIEVLYAKHWTLEAAKDELFIQDLSRRMIGARISGRGFSA